MASTGGYNCAPVINIQELFIGKGLLRMVAILAAISFLDGITVYGSRPTVITNRPPSHRTLSHRLTVSPSNRPTIFNKKVTQVNLWIWYGLLTFVQFY